MYDYGNARIAARRSRLLDATAERRLFEAGSPAALLALLGGHDDWRPVVSDVVALSADPAAAVDAAVERFRSRRLSVLRTWYPEPARRLVDALVLPLDVERLFAVLRRRWGGEPAEAIGAAVAPGALLGTTAIGRMARAPSVEATLLVAAHGGVLDAQAARSIGRHAAAGMAAPTLEASVLAATDARRVELTRGRRPDARAVRSLVEGEMASRAEVAAVLAESGVTGASAVERTLVLGRLDRLAAIGRRDRLGIGAVAGYVGAVEAAAMRIRAILAGVAGGWSWTRLGEYLEARPAAPAEG
jgi:vacuolar-type H+-ATPase subunit C/Vma6